MKVYLDDERKTPDGWVRVFWPDEAIELLSLETRDFVVALLCCPCRPVRPLRTELVFAVPGEVLWIGPQICVGWQSDLQAMKVS